MSNLTQNSPGEISDWPMLKLEYRTDPSNIAALLPPGFETGATPHVNITIYNYPVPDQPELGVLISVNASFNGIEGEYTLGYGIDQESAIFLSQFQNGQPKYPCTVEYYRFGNTIRARCIHQGYTFIEFEGTVAGLLEETEQREVNEWWIKVSRSIGVLPTMEYDFPPKVVQVNSTYATLQKEALEGELKLISSPWDPIADLLPMEEMIAMYLWTPQFLTRDIKFAGDLDPEGFKPHMDVISGSRWPGTFGGPKKV